MEKRNLKFKIGSILLVVLGVCIVAFQFDLGRFVSAAGYLQVTDLPSVNEVYNRNGDPELSYHMTADTQPVITGFANATNSEIILYLNENEVENTEIISVIDPRYGFPYWEFVWPTPLEPGEIYELQVSEIFANGNPAGGSDIFFMGILNVQSQLFLPYSNVAPAAPVPTPTPAAPIINGGFDQGENGWTFIDGALDTSVTAAGAISGTSARIGDPLYKNDNGVPEGYGEIRQTISVPESGGVLRFQYKILTHDRIYNASTQSLFDTFEVYINRVPEEDERRNACINNPGVDVNIENGIIFCNGYNDEASEYGPPNTVVGSQAISLNDFKGESVELYIRVYNRNDQYFNTWAFVDDFSVLSLTK